MNKAIRMIGARIAPLLLATAHSRASLRIARVLAADSRQRTADSKSSCSSSQPSVALQRVLPTAHSLQPTARAAVCSLTMLLVLFASSVAHAERVKDIASVSGVRSNQLVGYGLVVGLDGTGDQTSQAPFTIQSIRNMLAKFGVTIPANVNPQLKNVAAVTVHADLPPFSKIGQTIDVTVDSIGNAQSLRGGSLVITPLRGVDGEVYAMAQGSLIVSGFGVQGKDGSKISINVPSSGRVPNGASVEREVPTNFASAPFIMFNLNTPDFTTATRVVSGINHLLGEGTAQAVDAVSVRVSAPADPNQRIAYVSELEAIEIEPGDAPARVIVNSRTGTVVIGSHVRVTQAAVAHGSLSVTITERSDVSQPEPFSVGKTVTTPHSTIELNQQQARMFVFQAGVNLDEIVRAVNQVGAAPGDLVAILEALKEAGALRAELIVI
jgi:flagellar P-ring protein FlgI